MVPILNFNHPIFGDESKALRILCWKGVVRGGSRRRQGGLFSKSSYYGFSFLFLHKFACSYFYTRLQINWNMLNSEEPLLHFMNFVFIVISAQCVNSPL